MLNLSHSNAERFLSIVSMIYNLYLNFEIEILKDDKVFTKGIPNVALTIRLSLRVSLNSQRKPLNIQEKHNPSKAEATFMQSTKMQRFFKNHRNPCMLVFIA